MTDTTPEDVDAAADAAENIWEIELDKCDISFRMNMLNVGTIAGAVDGAAQTLGYNGISSFHLLITNPDTGERFVAYDNTIRRLEDVLDEARAPEDDDDPDSQTGMNLGED